MSWQKIPVDFSFMFSMGNFSKGKDNKVSKIFSSFFEISSIVISLNGSGISDNWAPVSEDIFSNNLYKGNWVKELWSPFLNFCNIILNVFAFIQISWEFLN